MKITLKGVLKVVRAVLPFVPGLQTNAHAGVTIGKVFVQAPPPPAVAPLTPVSGVAINIDAKFLAQIEGAEEIAQVIDPSNAVLFIASGHSADILRAALGLGTASALSA